MVATVPPHCGISGRPVATQLAMALQEEHPFRPAESSPFYRRIGSFIKLLLHVHDEFNSWFNSWFARD